MGVDRNGSAWSGDGLFEDLPVDHREAGMLSVWCRPVPGEVVVVVVRRRTAAVAGTVTAVTVFAMGVAGPAEAAAAAAAAAAVPATAATVVAAPAATAVAVSVPVPVDVSPVRVGYAHGRVYGRGADGRVWWRPVNPPPSGPVWRPIAGVVASGPAAVDTSTSDDPAGLRILLYARGPRGDLLTATQTSAGETAWVSLGGRLTSAPAAVRYEASHDVVVAVRGWDGSLALRGCEVDGTPAWPWKGVGGRLTSAPSIRDDYYNLTASVRGTDGRIWDYYYAGPDYMSGWFYQQIPTTSGPAVASSAQPGLHHLVHAWRDTRYRLQIDLVSGRRLDAGGYITSAPTAYTDPATSTHSDVYARGRDNALWRYTVADSGPGTWTCLGGTLT
jgi:hypothetical protein